MLFKKELPSEINEPWIIDTIRPTAHSPNSNKRKELLLENLRTIECIFIESSTCSIDTVQVLTFLFFVTARTRLEPFGKKKIGKSMWVCVLKAGRHKRQDPGRWRANNVHAACRTVRVRCWNRMRINENTHPPTHTHITSRNPRTVQVNFETSVRFGYKMLRHVTSCTLTTVSVVQENVKEGFRWPSNLFSFVGGKKRNMRWK